MIIAVTAQAEGENAPVEPRFGRTPYFIVVDTKKDTYKTIDNENQNAMGGAGIQSARLMADMGVKYILTGNCGPNAHRTLDAAGIGIIANCSGTVREVVENFKTGQFDTISAPTVSSHHGMGKKQ